LYREKPILARAFYSRHERQSGGRASGKLDLDLAFRHSGWIKTNIQNMDFAKKSCYLEREISRKLAAAHIFAALGFSHF
jgi:hypothetical protein